MTMRKLFIMLTILTAPSLASAQDSAKFAVGGGISTAGLDGSLTYKLHDRVNLRGTISGFSKNRNFNGKSGKQGSSVDFSAKASVFQLGALGDFYPFANGFRVTGGAVFNQSSLSLTAKPQGAGVYKIAGQTYRANLVEDLRGKAEWNKPGLFLGLGYGNPVSSAGLSFAAEVGAIVTGGPSTSLTVRCGKDIAGTSTCKRLQSDVEEEHRKVRNKLGSVSLFPILRVGLNYSF